MSKTEHSGVVAIDDGNVRLAVNIREHGTRMYVEVRPQGTLEAGDPRMIVPLEDAYRVAQAIADAHTLGRTRGYLPALETTI